MELQGWRINIESLTGPDRSKWEWLTDEIYESLKKDIACLVYSIAEVSMGWYAGSLAIFYNKEQPKLLINPSNIICHGYKEHVKYSKNGNYIYIRVRVYLEDENKIYIPFLIINTPDNTFSYVFLINGCHYTLEDGGNNTVRLNEIFRDTRFTSRNDDIVNLKELKWHNITKLNSFNKLIRKEARGINYTNND